MKNLCFSLYNNILIKKIINILLFVIAFIYLFMIVILIYIGPLETIFVKHKLRNNQIDIVVSFTTTPYRIDKIKPVLESIERQSIKPNRIYVNIPWKFKRENIEYLIPTWLKNYPNIIINRTTDYGPATKLIATLEKEKDPNTIIITIDDDSIYPKHMVRELAKQYLLESFQRVYQSSAVFTGFSLNFLFGPNYNLYAEHNVGSNKPSLLIIGAGGVAYKRNFFKDDIFVLLKNVPLYCFLSDDLMISAYLLANNITIIQAGGIYYNTYYVNLIKHLPTFSTKDALSQGANNLAHGSNETNYCHCLDFLSKQPNTVKYQKVILEKSKSIHTLYLSYNNFSNYTKQLFFYSLEEIVNFFPFMAQIVLLFIK